MPRDQDLLYAGIRECVVAFNPKTGAEVWRTPLKQKDFTNVLWDGENLFAANAGEVYCLDPRSGAVLWRNELKGLGRGLIGLASSRRAMTSSDSNVAAKRQQEAAAAAAAAG